MTVYASEDFVRIKETVECRIYTFNLGGMGLPELPGIAGQFDELAAEIGAGNTAICILGGAGDDEPFGLRQSVGPWFLESDGAVVTATKMVTP